MSIQNNRNTAAAKAEAAYDPSMLNGTPRLDQSSVLAAYARWAPFYDFVFSRSFGFGRLFGLARRNALAHINARQGSLLEIGVGTGVALGDYARHLQVTGIDLSPEMLRVARKKVRDEGLTHVVDLLEMDASRLTFADGTFDTAATMFTITVVPHPEAVMAEIERVLKPGGEALIVSHFASERGWRHGLETLMTPLTSRLGWRPDFPVARLLDRPGLRHLETRSLDPFGVFSMVRLQRV
ncbi:class I SAM-dependent methyltransferase [Prosthecomicrobium hirschii]|nr:methyltransferase domain-containing protein [Prosthecomicrobium hirschii]MCW1840745.1 methyltransferase domain-containing protein [Prosthecomicrobium hirschii]